MRLVRPALLAIALVSGTSALVYQMVWLRWFRLLFGSTAYAASATLCAFFLGLALGAALFGRVASGSRRPLRLYAGLELAAAALALVVPLLIGLYDPLYAALYERLADDRALFVAAKFALALAAMLPPAVCLGGTLPPPLVAALVREPAALGRWGNRLYGANTLGAALGTALGALWLPEALGVRATYGVGVALAVAAAAGAAWLERRSAPLAPPAAPARGAGRAPPLLLGVAFASGLVTLALEVLLVRALGQVMSSTAWSYGGVLLVVLLAIAAGALLVAASAGRVPARPLLAGVLAVQAVLLLLLPAAFAWLTGGLALWVQGSLANGLLLAAGLGGPVLLVGALVLPLTFRLAAGGAVAARVGGLLAANTLGGVLGALGASFVLLPGPGLWPAFAVLALLPGGVALWAARALGPRRRAAFALALPGVALAVLLSPATPLGVPRVSAAPGERVVAVEGGAHGVVSVLEADGELRLKIDNHYSLAGSGAARTEERAGHIPLLLHPAPRRVLFVGSASGATAAAAVLHPVTSIELVEIVPEVHALAARHFAGSTRGVHRDPRTRLVTEDGRNHLRAAPGRYDVVVADLFVPWRPGVGALYAREHFEAVRAHLAPGGVFCQWLPVYQLRREDFALVAATFLAVFPDATLWRGDFFATRPRVALVGSNGPPASVAAIGARLRALAEAGVADRWLTDPRGFWMLYMGPLAALHPAWTAGAVNSDDRPRFEFRAGRSRLAERRAFLREDWPRLADAARAGPDPHFPGRPGPGPAAASAFARASRAALERRPGPTRQALRAVRRLVPADLLATPDPSVAEVWP